MSTDRSRSQFSKLPIESQVAIEKQNERFSDYIIQMKSHYKGVTISYLPVGLEVKRAMKIKIWVDGLAVIQIDQDTESTIFAANTPSDPVIKKAISEVTRCLCGDKPPSVEEIDPVF